jgi:hypothetical protein
VLASPVREAVDGEAIAAKNREAGLVIGPDTGLTRWQGEAMDCGWAVQSLLRRRRVA